jgi:hypothetical protein
MYLASYLVTFAINNKTFNTINNHYSINYIIISGSELEYIMSMDGKK